MAMADSVIAVLPGEPVNALPYSGRPYRHFHTDKGSVAIPYCFFWILFDAPVYRSMISLQFLHSHSPQRSRINMEIDNP